MEGIAEDEQRILAGEHVSGPAADAYRYRVNAAAREFGGRVLHSERHARDLLGNPLLQIHHGDAITCVFDPATAACQLRGAVEDPMVTPISTTVDLAAATSPEPTATSPASSKRPTNWPSS
ncbi:hypothetical protein [Nocardia sp. NPDC005366]|uniref:hypothetical protein n=1 Tax=Nocardia sp. NPDC005366 TaxID=3156878 RepID=UPI0033B2D41B